MKRSWTNIKELEPQILEMRAAGKTRRESKLAITLQEYKYENKRLKMENELLRDFLQNVGRK